MSRDPLERFAEAWSHWVRRPPSTSPREAAAGVLRRIADAEAAQRPRPHRRWLAAAALLVLVLGAGALLLLPVPPAEDGGPRPPAGGTALPVDDGVVLLWLDPQTPLYLVVQPPPAAKGDAT